MKASSDYHTVARAIRFLREGYRSQPSLEEIASHVGLSPFHFQRLFTRWAGVSPKRFLQFLTVESAKERLRASAPVLQAAFATGLSGPARLHDLFISTTAVTPGEFKAGGTDLEIHHGVAETPFGPALFGTTHRGLCHLTFLGEGREEGSVALKVLAEAWPEASLIQDNRGASGLADAIFLGRQKPSADSFGTRDRPLSLLLKGTNFQIQVWEALLRVPPGALTTYGRLAQTLNRPGAARAVGTAVGRNAIAYLIPCHRVIREEGTLGGYRWGPVRKEAILGWEGAQKVS
jgi:AraC family transcriptional regulator of adaptative response/methylated-DNA-[protein]-cysteine methyltransferase